jgi:hypothetical protein
MPAAAEGEKVPNHKKSLRTSSEKLPVHYKVRSTDLQIFFFIRHGCHNVPDRIHFQAAGV